VRTFAVVAFVFGMLTGGIVGGWWAMNRFAVGNVGAPAHAGSLTNGHPEDCTNVNFQVKPRAQVVRKVQLEGGVLLRGTFEANGGFGRVDIKMSIVSPQGDVLLVSPRVSNYEFTLPVKLRGEYQFVFDNRYSLFTGKAVGFFYCLDTGQRRVAG
jgi:hypothetical protein